MYFFFYDVHVDLYVFMVIYYTYYRYLWVGGGVYGSMNYNITFHKQQTFYSGIAF